MQGRWTRRVVCCFDLGAAAGFSRRSGDERWCERADAIRDGGDGRRCGDGGLRTGEEACAALRRPCVAV